LVATLVDSFGNECLVHSELIAMYTLQYCCATLPVTIPSVRSRCLYLSKQIKTSCDVAMFRKVFWDEQEKLSRRSWCVQEVPWKNGSCVWIPESSRSMWYLLYCVIVKALACTDHQTVCNCCIYCLATLLQF